MYMYHPWVQIGKRKSNRTEYFLYLNILVTLAGIETAKKQAHEHFIYNNSIQFYIYLPYLTIQ
jgi:hypothetical protein